MSRALVLNATFEPLCLVSTRRAVVLVLAEKAELVHSSEGCFRSERLEFPEPSVVRLGYFVKVPYQARIGLNRRSVFARDGHRCQYCGSAAENIDHVVPRSRGGTHTWENVVAACRPCNNRKQDLFLHETPLSLKRTPVAPRERLWVLAATGGVRPDWEPYLRPASSLSAQSA
ncbi:MAG: HNH endonuclease [Actinomycetota bacterium]|nr:HNH endonuclease [Actinomycetota bacterium]